MAEPAVLVGWVERSSTKLAEHGVRHALVGGLALSVHGYTRATVDIDLVIDPADLPVARKALAELGLLQTDSALLTFERVAIFRALAIVDDDVLVFDLLMTDPVLWASVIARVLPTDIVTTTVPVVSPEDLVLLKLMRNDERDRLDIRELARVKPLDRDYLDQQAETLGLTAALASGLPRP